jgi:tripartite-type tricarboxylate transporter receptor subunit TctC
VTLVKKWSLAALALVATTIASAQAQTYPSRQITMIVPFPAGGPTDSIARVLAERMRATLGQTVIIENIGGAGGTLATTRVARAAPDGYMICLGHWTTHVLNGAVFALPYDVLADFEPVAWITDGPQWIAARKSHPANNLHELIAWLKANPDKGTSGVVGAVGSGRITGLYFQKATGTSFQFVPYRGAGPAMQDLVAGQIDIMVDQAANSLPQVRAGTIKAYAVTDKMRLAAAPDIPTVDEAGVPGLHISIWHALWMPKGTPKDIIARLNAAVMDALADAGARQRLAELGQEIPPREQQSPQVLFAYHKAEIEKWWPIIKAANIKGE